jgi:hypothetical protein
VLGEYLEFGNLFDGHPLRDVLQIAARPRVWCNWASISLAHRSAIGSQSVLPAWRKTVAASGTQASGSAARAGSVVRAARIAVRRQPKPPPRSFPDSGPVAYEAVSLPACRQVPFPMPRMRLRRRRGRSPGGQQPTFWSTQPVR